MSFCAGCGTSVRMVKLGDEMVIYEHAKYYDVERRCSTGPHTILHTQRRCAQYQESKLKPVFPPGWQPPSVRELTDDEFAEYEAAPRLDEP